MTAPDPKTVREIAREHLTDFASRYPNVHPFFVGGRVLDAVGDQEMWRTDHDGYIAWCDAVVAEIRAMVPTWPNEQQPAEATGGEQAQDDFRAIVGERDDFRAQLRTELAISAELRRRNDELATERCHAEGERDALAARVAELEGEREAVQPPALAPCCGGPHAGWMHTAECRTPRNPLHARFAHPGWEYATTQGPRKSWDQIDEPPEGSYWERNVDAGRNGWERFDYHEESYWRRLRPLSPQQPPETEES